MVKKLLLASTAGLLAFALGKTLTAGPSRLSPSPVATAAGGERGRTGEGQLPVHFQTPAFTLTGSDGKVFSSTELAGKPWIADFIYTRCAGQCPMMTQRVQEVSRRLPGFRLVSFSLDPKDTPRVLRAYAEKVGAGWTFLTGKPGVVRDLSVKGFKLGVADGGPPEEPISHSKYLVLVDPAGAIRGYYDAMDDAAFSRLVHDADRLASGR